MVFYTPKKSPKATVCKSLQTTLTNVFKKHMNTEKPLSEQEQKEKEFLKAAWKRAQEKFRLKEEEQRQEKEKKQQEMAKRDQECQARMEERHRQECERLPNINAHRQFFDENSHLNGVPGVGIAYLPHHNRVESYSSKSFYKVSSHNYYTSDTGHPPKRSIVLNSEASVCEDDLFVHHFHVLFEYEKCVGLIESKTYKRRDDSIVKVSRFFSPTSYPGSYFFPVSMTGYQSTYAGFVRRFCNRVGFNFAIRITILGQREPY